MGEKDEEEEPLLSGSLGSSASLVSNHPVTHLTVLFAVACIVDQFGVNPVVVLPRAIILCGWVGFPLAIFVFSLTIYTAMLLGRCWVMAEHIDSNMNLKSRYPYSALSEMAWGRTTGKIINVILNVAVFTSNIPALLLAAQNLQSFDAKVSDYAFNFSYCYWLVILGCALCPLTWLGSPKDTKWISMISACSVFVCAILTWGCMFWDDTRHAIYEDIPAPNWQSIGIAFGILAFQLGCHPAILAIQTDMHDKTHLSQSVLVSFFVTGGLSMMTTCMATFLYGGKTHANLTQGLPTTIALYIDILIVTLQLFLSTVVGGCALFHDIEDKLGIPRELCWQRCVIRTLLVMLSVLMGELLPRFDLVMGLLGGLLTGPITFIFPPLLYRRFRQMLAEDRLRSRIEYITRDVVPYPKDEIRDFAASESPKKSRSSSMRQSGSFSRYRHKLQEFIKKHFFALDVTLDDGALSTWETTTISLVVFIGASATGIATYFSLRGAVWTSHNTPPCLFGVKAASTITNNT